MITIHSIYEMTMNHDIDLNPEIENNNNTCFFKL